ncbi:unnamed protein product [Soboliphyme baturini]|uniref:FLYWCH-type domain-containing protein n=1 Tax=Soboliphyme baturini TaxID=241478 RepID=A0A183IGA8_9BILA|nr:unnamed protein product [Soboliphyme baturini]
MKSGFGRSLNGASVYLAANYDHLFLGGFKRKYLCKENDGFRVRNTWRRKVCVFAKRIDERQVMNERRPGSKSNEPAAVAAVRSGAGSATTGLSETLIGFFPHSAESTEAVPTTVPSIRE